VDISYEAGEGVTLTTFVTQEQYATTQQSRQWNPDSVSGSGVVTPGVGNPYSSAPSPADPSNWTLDSTTVVRTIGMRTDIRLVPDRLSMRIEGGATATNGRLDYSSVLSTTTPADANMWIPNDVLSSDETRSANAGLSFRYQVTKTIWGMLAYRYDLRRIRDDLRDGYTPVAVNWAGAYNGLLAMGTFTKDYEVHTVYAQVGMTF
jgi:hypothetical protein